MGLSNLSGGVLSVFTQLWASIRLRGLVKNTSLENENRQLEHNRTLEPSGSEKYFEIGIEVKSVTNPDKLTMLLDGQGYWGGGVTRRACRETS